MCGGYYNSYACVKWRSVTGTWENYLANQYLHVGRRFHVSWTPDPDIGTYLMGGWESGDTTTLIKPDGSQEPGFSLKYHTEYVSMVLTNYCQAQNQVLSPESKFKV